MINFISVTTGQKPETPKSSFHKIRADLAMCSGPAYSPPAPLLCFVINQRHFCSPTSEKCPPLDSETPQFLSNCTSMFVFFSPVGINVNFQY